MLSLQFVYVPKLWQCLHLSESSWAHLPLGSGWRKLGLCQRDRMGSLAAAVASATHTVAIATTTLAVSAAALALS